MTVFTVFIFLLTSGDEPLHLKAATGGGANDSEGASTAQLNFAELSGANDGRAFADLGLKERSSILVEGCAKLGTAKVNLAYTSLCSTCAVCSPVRRVCLFVCVTQRGRRCNA